MDAVQEGYQFFRRALVDAAPLGQDVDVRKESEESGAGLMDGAHDCAALLRQRPQQLHALRARGTVQTTAEKAQI